MQQAEGLAWYQALNQLEIPYLKWHGHSGKIPAAVRDEVENRTHGFACGYELLEERNLMNPWRIAHDGISYIVAELYGYSPKAHEAEGFLIFPLGVIDIDA